MFWKKRKKSANERTRLSTLAWSLGKPPFHTHPPSRVITFFTAVCYKFGLHWKELWRWRCVESLKKKTWFCMPSKKHYKMKEAHLRTSTPRSLGASSARKAQSKECEPMCGIVSLLLVWRVNSYTMKRYGHRPHEVIPQRTVAEVLRTCLSRWLSYLQDIEPSTHFCWGRR